MASKGGDLFQKWVVDPISQPARTVAVSDPLSQALTGHDVSFNPDKNLDSALRTTYQTDPIGSTIGGNENDAVRAGKIAAAAAALFFTAGAAGVGAEGGGAGAGAGTEAGGGAAAGGGASASTVAPLVDAGTGATAVDAGAVAQEGLTAADYLKYAKDAAGLVGAGASVAKAAAKPPTPPTAPAPPPPPQGAQGADTTAIRRRNSLLFGADSPATTDITGGRAGISNLGRVSLLGGTSKLGT